MKVILLGRVENVGEAGDIVEVSDGHARNYLFPQGLAAVATPERIAAAEQKKQERVETERLALEEVQRWVTQLDGKTIVLQRPVGPEGTLFGAVTNKDITEELRRVFNITLPKGVVRLKEPIKHVGEKPVHLEFPHGLEADLVVLIEAEVSGEGQAKGAAVDSETT